MADDGGITLAALAELRGVSKDAARRLVRSGKVSAHQIPGAHGREWCCHPDGEIPDRQTGAGDAPGLHQPGATVAQAEDVAALVAMVGHLTAENGELVRAVAAWQSQAVFLAGRLADAEERLALTAPVGRTENETVSFSVPPAVSPPASNLTPQPAPLTVESPGTPSRLRMLALAVLAAIVLAIAAGVWLLLGWR